MYFNTFSDIVNDMGRRLNLNFTCRNDACKADFRPYYKGQLYCSRACYRSVMDAGRIKRIRKNKKRPPLTEKVCQECGATFLSRANNFCSKICYQIHRSRGVLPAHSEGSTCVVCGKNLPPLNRKYCSRSCYRKENANLETPNRWQRRQEQEDQRRHWQSQILVDDGHACGICGKDGPTINPSFFLDDYLKKVYNPYCCLECYIGTTWDSIRAGVCIDCGAKINHKNFFCTSCGKHHNHGEFIVFEKERNFMLSITAQSIVEIRQEKRKQTLMDQREKAAARKELDRQRTEERKKARAREIQRRKYYNAGLKEYERARKKGVI